jgi:hypothetical protein
MGQRRYYEPRSGRQVMVHPMGQNLDHHRRNGGVLVACGTYQLLQPPSGWLSASETQTLVEDFISSTGSRSVLRHSNE